MRTQISESLIEQNSFLYTSFIENVGLYNIPSLWLQ
jgi:hypothetical protein